MAESVANSVDTEASESEKKLMKIQLYGKAHSGPRKRRRKKTQKNALEAAQEEEGHEAEDAKRESESEKFGAGGGGNCEGDGRKDEGYEAKKKRRARKKKGKAKEEQEQEQEQEGKHGDREKTAKGATAKEHLPYFRRNSRLPLVNAEATASIAALSVLGADLYFTAVGTEVEEFVVEIVESCIEEAVATASEYMPAFSGVRSKNKKSTLRTKQKYNTADGDGYDGAGQFRSNLNGRPPVYPLVPQPGTQPVYQNSGFATQTNDAGVHFAPVTTGGMYSNSNQYVTAVVDPFRRESFSYAALPRGPPFPGETGTQQSMNKFPPTQNNGQLPLPFVYQPGFQQASYMDPSQMFLPSNFVNSDISAGNTSSNFFGQSYDCFHGLEDLDQPSDSLSLEILVQDLAKALPNPDSQIRSKFASPNGSSISTSSISSDGDSSSPRTSAQARSRSWSSFEKADRVGYSLQQYKESTQHNVLRQIYRKYDHEREVRVQRAIMMAETERARRIAEVEGDMYQEKLERARRLEWAIKETERERRRQTRRDRAFERRMKKSREQWKKCIIQQEEAERNRRIKRGADADIVLAALRKKERQSKREARELHRAKKARKEALKRNGELEMLSQSESPSDMESSDTDSSSMYDSGSMSESEDYLTQSDEDTTSTGADSAIKRSTKEKKDEKKKRKKKKNDGNTPYTDDYEVVCPYTILGCGTTCMRSDLERHLEKCAFRAKSKDIPDADRNEEYLSLYNPLDLVVDCPYKVVGCTHRCSRAMLPGHLLKCAFQNDDVDPGDFESFATQPVHFDLDSYEIVCPYSVMGCTETMLRSEVSKHFNVCKFAPASRQEEEEAIRTKNKSLAILAAETERKRRLTLDSASDLITKERSERYKRLLQALIDARLVHIGSSAQSEHTIDETQSRPEDGIETENHTMKADLFNSPEKSSMVGPLSEQIVSPTSPRRSSPVQLFVGSDPSTVGSDATMSQEPVVVPPTSPQQLRIQEEYSISQSSLPSPPPHFSPSSNSLPLRQHRYSFDSSNVIRAGFAPPLASAVSTGPTSPFQQSHHGGRSHHRHSHSLTSLQSFFSADSGVEHSMYGNVRKARSPSVSSQLLSVDSVYKNRESLINSQNAEWIVKAAEIEAIRQQAERIAIQKKLKKEKMNMSVGKLSVTSKDTSTGDNKTSSISDSAGVHSARRRTRRSMDEYELTTVEEISLSKFRRVQSCPVLRRQIPVRKDSEWSFATGRKNSAKFSDSTYADFDVEVAQISLLHSKSSVFQETPRRRGSSSGSDLEGTEREESSPVLLDPGKTDASSYFSHEEESGSSLLQDGSFKSDFFEGSGKSQVPIDVDDPSRRRIGSPDLSTYGPHAGHWRPPHRRTASISDPHGVGPPHVLSLQNHMDEQARSLNRTLHRDLLNLAGECKKSSDTLKPAVQEIQERVRRIATYCFGYDVRVNIFGSFATGLAVPPFSDVDLVIITNEDCTGLSGSMMCNILGRVMVNAEWVNQLKVLDRAKMPVIKLVTTPSATKAAIPLSVDLTFALPSHAGVATVEYVKGLAEEFSNVLTPLTVALKKVLAKHSLNDPFTGGMGSYALVLLIVASLNKSLDKKSNRRRSFAEEDDELNFENESDWIQHDGRLGTFLLDFLQLYGRDFDPMEEAIVSVPSRRSAKYHHRNTVRIGKRFQARSSVQHQNGMIPSAVLVVDDPIQARNNVGASCFRFKDVQRALADIYARLLAYTVRCKTIDSDRQSSSATTVLEQILF